jgi:hypothetical protein
MKFLEPLLGFMKLDQQAGTCLTKRWQIKKGVEIKCDSQETCEKLQVGLHVEGMQVFTKVC